MRPTVMPQELKEVRKHETVQKILKKKRAPEDKDGNPPPPTTNDFLDNLVARNVKGQQPAKKAMTQNRIFRPDYMKRPQRSEGRGNGYDPSGSRTPPRY